MSFLSTSMGTPGWQRTDEKEKKRKKIQAKPILTNHTIAVAAFRTEIARRPNSDKYTRFSRTRTSIRTRLESNHMPHTASTTQDHPTPTQSCSHQHGPIFRCLPLLLSFCVGFSVLFSSPSFSRPVVCPCVFGSSHSFCCRLFSVPFTSSIHLLLVVLHLLSNRVYLE